MRVTKLIYCPPFCLASSRVSQISAVADVLMQVSGYVRLNGTNTKSTLISLPTK
jgi:hypothetical protein